MLRPRSDWEEFSEQRKNRSLLFTAMITVGFAIIALRLWQLQIVQYSTFSHRAENNRIRQITLDGHRGKILDRTGRTLVDNRPSFQLSIIPEDVKDMDRTLKFLHRHIDFDMREVMKNVKKSARFRRVIVKRDISREHVAFVEERRIDLPGVYLQVKALRHYRYGALGAHLLGYLGAVTTRQLANNPHVYSMDDFVGQYGLEKSYEDILRGSKGLKRVEVDAEGRELSQIGISPPSNGNDLVISIDYKTQMEAEKAFKKEMGAAIAIDPYTGQVLAMVSKPSFDPNIFASGISGKEWKTVTGNRFHPLQNRVTQGQYPPGSTFKIVVAAGALEEGIISEQTKIFCPGYFRLGSRRYHCWKRGGHGYMNVKTALAQSCDVFFYTVGLKLGIDRIAKYARKFGMGQPVHLGAGAQSTGLIPTMRWKLKARKKPWIIGETVSCSIGQGYVLATPAQQVRMISAIANKGLLVKPWVVQPGAREGKTGDNSAVSQALPKRIDISAKTIDLIRQALRSAVADPHGTGWRLKNGPYTYAGKTGTSQVIKQNVRDMPKNIEDIKFRFRDHAWFVAFAPYEDPKIAVAVIAEHAGHGGATSAVIAKRIMDAYLGGLPPAKTGATAGDNTISPSPAPPNRRGAEQNVEAR